MSDKKIIGYHEGTGFMYKLLALCTNFQQPVNFSFSYSFRFQPWLPMIRA